MILGSWDRGGECEGRGNFAMNFGMGMHAWHGVGGDLVGFESEMFVCIFCEIFSGRKDRYRDTRI